MKDNPILDVYSSKKTVFSMNDLILIWKEENKDLVKLRAHRYLKAGKLKSIRRGFYVKNDDYDKDELATKIYKPSYISFETVLGRAGVTFQYYESILVASYLSREITVNNQKYIYSKIKDTVLTNSIGIEHNDNYSIATPERAFLDILYLHKTYHFDNLSPLNWEKVYEILPIYNSKKMGRMVRMFHEHFKKENEHSKT